MDDKGFKIENLKIKVDGEKEETQIVVPPLPPEVMEQARARAVASDLLATMPDFWKDKFEKVIRQHGGSRKGRAATEALLRRYKSWKTRTERLRARQAKDREERAMKRLGEAFGVERKEAEPALVAVGTEK